ncbi:MAG: GNAT family N-acetyltransferase [Chitinophagaceae bacterium]
MNSEVVIRHATIADAPMVADFSRKTFYDAFAADNTAANVEKYLNEQFTRTALMKELELPGNIFLLAFRDNELVGYVRLREATEDALSHLNALEIARIYLDQSEKGRGTGSKLMQHCIDIALELQKQVIWLGVWEHNAGGIAFYRKWGFEKFGSHIFMLGDDPQTDWLMKKML